MAGIDWLRWHHGSVTDPKFQLIAKKAGVTVAEVIAFWAFVLESASQADVRGDVFIDVEAVECLLGLEDGKGQVIFAAMKDRGLLSTENRVSSWDKRQPRREREDDSQERVAAYRKRQQQEESANNNQEEPKESSNATVTPSNANVTPEQTTVTQETPRVEKSRQEHKNIAHSRFDFFKALVDCGVDESVANDYITTRKAKKCVQTETAFRQLSAEVTRSGMTFADAALLCCRKGWGGFDASWIKDEDRRKQAITGDPNEIITLPDGRQMTRSQRDSIMRLIA